MVVPLSKLISSYFSFPGICFVGGDSTRVDKHVELLGDEITNRHVGEPLQKQDQKIPNLQSLINFPTIASSEQIPVSEAGTMSNDAKRATAGPSQDDDDEPDEW